MERKFVRSVGVGQAPFALKIFVIFAHMKRFFNTTGVCNPKDHYMVDPSRDIYNDILRLIEAK